MRGHTVLALAFLLCLSGCSTHSEINEHAGSFRRIKSEWSPVPSVRRGPYTIYEKTSETNGGVERKLFVAGKHLHEPRHFYTHHREVSITLGNTEDYFLVNDHCTSKENKVIIVEIATGQKKDIGQAAMDRYRKDFSPNTGLWIVPVGRGFSEDDTAVLVEAKLIYIDGHSGDKADQLAKAFQERWYMIDHETLEIVAEHEKAVQL